MKLRAIILGCGSSGGVPRPGGPYGRGHWGDCDPNEPKNRRTRCSLLVQRAHPELEWATTDLTSVLIDTSPDMNAQLLKATCGRLDAVLYSHEHADQCHGIDDLRIIAINMMQRVPVYVDDATSGNLLKRFDYCFEQAEGSSYPAILERKVMPAPGEMLSIEGPSGSIDMKVFLQNHGAVDSLGFIFGDMTKPEETIAYSSDVNDLPDVSFDMLQNCGVWIVDALRPTPHPSHAHLDLTLQWIERVKADKGILTNLHIDMDYQTLLNQLPPHIRPAYDNMHVVIGVN